MGAIARSLILLPLAACAGPNEVPETDPSVEETYVYLQSVSPPQVSYFRYMEPLRYRVINRKFVTVTTQTGVYLVETQRLCPSLVAAPAIDMADQRRMRGRLRAGADTIRGCRIENIYRVAEPEPDEAAPGGEPEIVPQTGTEVETSEADESHNEQSQE